MIKLILLTILLFVLVRVIIKDMRKPEQRKRFNRETDKYFEVPIGAEYAKDENGNYITIKKPWDKNNG